MEAAKSSVKKFMSNSGHHDTTVHEKVAPAVTNETVSREQHERSTTAVDKEVHQDHYHTTEQPVNHSEVLPEQHHHNIVPTEHRSYEHDNADDVQRKLQTEQSRYRDQQTHVEGQRTSTAEPTVAGEHVHHHVHETIQPVVQKQTVEPHVVHTTVPVHEVHHNAAKHHQASALPPVSMDDFKHQGGALTGREERHDKFDGCPPEQIAGHNGGHSSSRTAESTSALPTTGSHSTRDATSALPTTGDHHSSHETSSRTPQTISDSTGSSSGPFNSHKHDNTVGQPSSSLGHSSSSTNQGTYGNDMHTDKPTFGTTGATGTTGTSGSTSSAKPSMMDKLNPMKDANGDGQKGFMK